MYRKRGMAVMGMLGVVAALLAGTPATAAGSSERSTAGSRATDGTTAGSATSGLKWAACPEDVVMPPVVVAQVLCAKVPVPLDYSDPDGTQIELMVSRMASTKPEKRRGVLMFNPGGPGGTGLDQPGFMVSKGLPASVMDAYDLIGMDTRGVGHSAPVSCGLTTDDEYLGNIPPYAADDAAVARQAGIAKEIAAKCAVNDTDGRLRHLTTATMARDLDRIRTALGEPKASFYGAS